MPLQSNTMLPHHLLLLLVLICLVSSLQAKVFSKSDSDATFQIPDRTVDWCARLAKQPQHIYALRCLNSFPFDQRLFDETIESIRRTMPLIVFLDTARNTPDKQYQPDYDLQAKFDQIRKKRDWINDREWQERLSKAFLPMNDAHLSYSPLCYRQIYYRQPFYVSSYMDEKRVTRFFVSALSSGAAPEDKAHIGREVLAVDGMPAHEHFYTYVSKRVGQYKDITARFTNLFARMQLSTNGKSWAVQPGSYSSRVRLPAAFEFTWTLAAGKGRPKEDLVREWEVFLPKTPFKSAREYWEAFCVKTKKPQTASINKDVPKPPPKPVDSTITVDFMHNITTHPNRRPDQHADLYLDARPAPTLSFPGLALFFLKDAPQVAVLSVHTFSFSNSNDTLAWRKGLATIIEEIHARNAKRLLLDLSDNGGGNACLASELLAVLTPHSDLPFPAVKKVFYKDQRLSPLMKLLIKTSIERNKDSSTFHPSWYTDVRTGKPFNGWELVSPARRRPLATPGSDRDYWSNQDKEYYPYSQYFTDICYPPKDNPLGRVRLGFPPSALGIISNGLCGSACGRVYHHLIQVSKVKDIVTGALRSPPRTGAGFPATQVIDFDYLQSQLGILKLDDQESELVPKPFTVNAVFRWPMRESYGWTDAKTPMEYIRYKAGMTLDLMHEDILRPARVWHRAALMLKWTKDPFDMTDVFDHQDDGGAWDHPPPQGQGDWDHANNSHSGHDVDSNVVDEPSDEDNESEESWTPPQTSWMPPKPPRKAGVQSYQPQPTWKPKKQHYQSPTTEWKPKRSSGYGTRKANVQSYQGYEEPQHKTYTASDARSTKSKKQATKPKKSTTHKKKVTVRKMINDDGEEEKHVTVEKWKHRKKRVYFDEEENVVKTVDE
jgi:hypothetical protein